MIWIWMSTSIIIMVAAAGTGLLGLVVVYLFYPALKAATTERPAVSVTTLLPSAALPAPAAQPQQQQPLLAIVIPAYNEELRLPVMLAAAYRYLNQHNHHNNASQKKKKNQKKEDATINSDHPCGCEALENLYQAAVLSGYFPQNQDNNNNEVAPTENPKQVVIEWIICNDGSTDRTEQVVKDFVQQQQEPEKGAAAAAAANTNSAAKKSFQVFHVWKWLSLQQNTGKGAAVQAGMLESSSLYALMVDADGATEFGRGLAALTRRLVTELQQQIQEQQISADELNHCIVLGSRAHLQKQNQQQQDGGEFPNDELQFQDSQDEDDSNNNKKDDQGVRTIRTLQGGRALSKTAVTGRRSALRTLLMQGFHRFVVLLVGAPDIEDTQCGFKLFPRAVIPKLFGPLHIRQWAFDTELVYLAKHVYGRSTTTSNNSNNSNPPIRMYEVPVPWHEVDGSKLHTNMWNVIWVAVGMLRDMMCIRVCYSTGLWTTTTTTATTTTAATTTTTTMFLQQQRQEQEQQIQPQASSSRDKKGQ